MRIAICDDEIPMHDLLKRHLDSYARKRNLSVMYSDYTGGQELLAFPQDLDLIFMDYQMKDLDGLETARRLRAAHIDTPIIFLTSFPHIVFDTFEVHAYRFLVKPVDPEKLTAVHCNQGRRSHPPHQYRRYHLCRSFRQILLCTDDRGRLRL